MNQSAVSPAKTRQLPNATISLVERFAQATRSHWGIENSLHWCLDVAFHEDDSRIRTGYAPQNLAVIRHMALNLLSQESSAKFGKKAKRLKAGWDNAYLTKVLAEAR